jgi:hypothetical protein
MVFSQDQYAQPVRRASRSSRPVCRHDILPRKRFLTAGLPPGSKKPFSIHTLPELLPVGDVEIPYVIADGHDQMFTGCRNEAVMQLRRLSPLSHTVPGGEVHRPGHKKGFSPYTAAHDPVRDVLAYCPLSFSMVRIGSAGATLCLRPVCPEEQNIALSTASSVHSTAAS